MMRYRMTRAAKSGAIYIYLPPYDTDFTPAGAVKHTVVIAEGLHLDMDGAGRVIGIEYLGDGVTP